MLTKELLKKIKKIEIKTSRLVNDVFSGEYHSIFRGRGMEFSEVREYVPGDDVRNIDWNVTARYNHPYVKVFREERELTVMLLVDLSASGDFGSSDRMRREISAELAAILAFSATRNNDKVGLLLFTDKIEKFIPPKKGKNHVLRLIREVLYFEPDGRKTDIAGAMDYMLRVIKKKSVMFLISDFLDKDFQRPMGLAANKHDLIAVEIYDPLERRIPNSGIVNLVDLETGREMLVDFSNKANRLNLAVQAETRRADLHDYFRRRKIDKIEIGTNQDYTEPLYRFFERRARRIRH
ncbi:MAG: DUF58 domain-containing protein [candidate division Zixibacteria bacterium]|nr:DUF58 domain-containing protein [candidate division Zixibacteria bacterium]